MWGWLKWLINEPTVAPITPIVEPTHSSDVQPIAFSSLNCTRAVAVKPNNDDYINSGPVRGVYVGGGGHLRVMMNDDSRIVTFTSVPAGTVLPISIKRVFSSGTTATNIVGLI